MTTCEDRSMIEKLHLEFFQYITDGNSEMVKEYLDNPSIDPTWGKNRAITLSTCLDDGEIMKMLLNDGRADPAVSNSYHLRLTIMNNKIQMVKMLLEDGRADPTHDEHCCIKRAALLGHVEIVDLLLKDGRADPNAILSIWYGFGYQGPKKKVEIMALLIKDSRIDKISPAIIEYAHVYKDIPMIKLLLENDCITPELIRCILYFYILKEDNHQIKELFEEKFDLRELLALDSIRNPENL